MSRLWSTESGVHSVIVSAWPATRCWGLAARRGVADRHRGVVESAVGHLRDPVHGADGIFEQSRARRRVVLVPIEGGRTRRGPRNRRLPVPPRNGSRSRPHRVPTRTERRGDLTTVVDIVVDCAPARRRDDLQEVRRSLCQRGRRLGSRGGGGGGFGSLARARGASLARFEAPHRASPLRRPASAEEER